MGVAQVAVPVEGETSLLEQVFKSIDSRGPDAPAPSAQQVTAAPPADNPKPHPSNPGRPTILNLTRWVRDTNPSTSERESAQACQLGEPK